MPTPPADAHVAGAITPAVDMDMAGAFTSHSSTPEWKFDTGSSAHMTDDIGQFECLTPSYGSVRVEGTPS